MSVRFLTFDNEQVSFEWYVFLTAARKAGVAFHLNEGHRTMERQWQFWGIYQRNGWPLAAYPSATAPHIRDGRCDHAIDVNGAAALIAYGRRVGVTLVRTVRGEEWHLEAVVSQLTAFAKRHEEKADPLSFLQGDERRWVQEYVKLKAADRDRDRRAVLRRVMSERRQMIYRAATGNLKGAAPGWGILNRRARWTILRRYTT